MTFIATTINKALKEQLDPVFIARKIKTLEGMDYRQFLPSTQCQFTSWSRI